MDHLVVNQTLFTCLSCSIAFLSAEEQRVHYHSDYHRYNMKRRIASLPPVNAAVFDRKVLERRAETAVVASAKDLSCTICNKIYTTEGAYRSHVNSKKHKDNDLKSLTHVKPQADIQPSEDNLQSGTENSLQPVMSTVKPVPYKDVSAILPTKMASLAVSDEENFQSIDEKISAARARLSPSQCLFCPHESTSLECNLTHMSNTHSFFIPDAEYLVDILGLMSYLGEKIAVGNVCIFCNDKGREFRSLDAVRKHMIDKSHCKIAYDSSDDRLEISDFYDFTNSYPDAKKSKEEKRRVEDGWEDLEDSYNEGEGDEIVNENFSDEYEDSDSDESVPDNSLTYGDSHLELVLPSGARIGHRTMRRYYAQSFPRSNITDNPNSGAALVRRLLSDKNSALVPRKGGFGAFGKGTDVVKARNHGEAREAGRHVREFRDQKRREDFRTKIGFIANAQKHFRDPLLQ